MTRKERIYFYQALQNMFNEWAKEYSGEEIIIAKQHLKSFAERMMPTVTGQQYLPQDIFRIFLKEIEPILGECGIKSLEEKVESNITKIESNTTKIEEINTKINTIGNIDDLLPLIYAGL